MYDLHFITADNAEEYEFIRQEVDRVILHAAHGEFTGDDLKAMIAAGRAYAAFITTDEGLIELAWVWEMVFYPRKTVVNVMAMAGRRFKECCVVYFELVKDLWRAQGATAVTSYTSPAMARLLARAGFCEKYRFLEMELNDAHGDE